LKALITLLTQPERGAEFSLQDWDIIIRQARVSGMLGALYHVLKSAEVLNAVAKQPKCHLLAGGVMADRHTEVACSEIDKIYKTFEHAGIPVLALKGAAYALAELSACRGRIFGDIDIMVPHGALGDAEKILKHSGWLATHHSDYDDQYYRRWMHEIPPLIHSTRLTILDVHHNILPLTANLKPQAEKLWEDAVRIEGYDDLYRLSNPDLILHSATHLFQGSEYDRGLRDLFDIARLIHQFRELPGFWESLCARADELDLVPPLAYALRYVDKVLAVQVPLLPTLIEHKKYPSKGKLKWMDKCFKETLQAHYLLRRSAKFANFILYLRGHYLRMPAQLLIPHLLYKATMAKWQTSSSHPAEIENPLQDFLNQGKG